MSGVELNELVRQLRLGRDPAGRQLGGDPLMELALLTRAAFGDQAARSEVYQQYICPAVGFALKQNRSEAGQTRQDLANAVFVKLFEEGKHTNFTGRCGMGPWLRVLAKRYLIDLKRKSARGKQAVQKVALQSSSTVSTPLEHLLAAEDIEKVRQWISSLPSDNERLIVILWANSWTFKNIARVVGLNPGNVCRAAKRLMRRLKRWLEGK